MLAAATMSLRQLLNVYQLAERDCNGAVSDLHLEEISRSYCTKWKSLPAHLGLKGIVVNDIDLINGSEAEKRHALLKKWKEANGLDATYKQLISALLAIECRADAEGVCELLQKSLVLPQQSAPVLASRSATSEPDVKMSAVLVKENQARIKLSFAALVIKVTSKLGRKDIDMKDFRLYILNLFPPGDIIADTVSVADIFEAVSRHQLWDYLYCTPIEGIAKQFGGDDLELRGWLDDYKSELAGFKATTKIVDYIKVCNDEEEIADSDQSLRKDIARYDRRYCRKLTVKLKSRVTEKSLDYIDQFWRSIADHFLLPSLSALLDSIQEGCVEVTWLVPTLSALQIQANIQDSKFLSKFLEKLEVIRVIMEGEILYEQDLGKKLLKACERGDIDEVKALLTYGVDVDTATAGIQVKNHSDLYNDSTPDMHQEKKTALLLAAENGHKVLVEILLHHGADMYLHDRNGGSVLSLSKCHSSLHEWLQDKCEDFLITASKKGDVELVEKSLKIGVNPNARGKDEYGWTALLWACDNGHTDVVDCLLEHNNVDANVHDSQNWTGLTLSSRRGYLSIVKKLLDKGADVNILTKILWSALHWTAQEGHTEVARLLLERGAIANTQDEAGFTPLLQASQDGHLDVVKVLVEHAVNSGIDLDQHTTSDWTAIMAATKNGHEDIVKYLVDHDFNPHYHKEDGVTALHIASFKGHKDIVRYLCVTQRLEVNVKDTDGITPLMYAAKQGHSDSVRTLFENGRADPNLKENDNGWTALFFAVEAQQYEVLYYLLRSGRADVTQRDDNHTSLVDLAKSINPEHRALGLLSRYHKTKTEAMIREVKPVNMEIYTTMLEKFQNFRESLGTADPRTPLSVGAG